MKHYKLILTMFLVSVVAIKDSPADVMARNILEWIQGIYQQGVRKTRQQSEIEYLPPYSTQRPPEKPRPFQSVSTQQPLSISNLNQKDVPKSYSDYGSFSEQGYSSNRPLSMFSFTNIQSNSGNTIYKTASSDFSSTFEGYPASSTTYLPPKSIVPGYPYPSSGDRPKPNFPTPNLKSNIESGPVPKSNIKSESISVSRPGDGSIPVQTPDDDDDLKHPPHIHSLDVECTKTMMTINIEFNRIFDGVIYSKGFFMMPQCRYVEQNSGQVKYSFTLNLDSCGTQFINDFEGEAGQAYLENILVLQNEPGIQEVWDTVRTVRCLWEGNINKALKVSLSVDMLNQELVTFNGDTAMAKLDIQVGKGPFAPAANGLVKIGDTMTLVVSVEGDPAFDLQVRDCVARDEFSRNIYELTDERGCILKPKLFGAFQKTNETGNSGASIISYAFFHAFKFPDVMDLFIECNVELCKTNCEPCSEVNQQIEPGRRRRSIIYSNWKHEHLNEAVRVGRGFRVVMPEDLPDVSAFEIYDGIPREISKTRPKEIQSQLVAYKLTTLALCFSYSSFYTTFITLLIILALSSLSTLLMYAKFRKIRNKKGYN